MNQDYSNIYKYYEALVKTSFVSHKYATTYAKYQENQVKLEDKNDVEFEISNDFLEFYRESLKYKKEKSIFRVKHPLIHIHTLIHIYIHSLTHSHTHLNKIKNPHNIMMYFF
jgi:hypothetical protein